jgi:hypothetical protein
MLGVVAICSKVVDADIQLNEIWLTIVLPIRTTLPSIFLNILAFRRRSFVGCSKIVLRSQEHVRLE